MFNVDDIVTYVDVTEVLEVKPTKGKGRNTHMQTFEQYVLLEKIGRGKFKIVEIYNEPKIKEDKRKYNGQSEGSKQALQKHNDMTKMFKNNQLEKCISCIAIKNLLKEMGMSTLEEYLDIDFVTMREEQMQLDNYKNVLDNQLTKQRQLLKYEILGAGESPLLEALSLEHEMVQEEYRTVELEIQKTVAKIDKYNRNKSYIKPVDMFVHVGFCNDYRYKLDNRKSKYSCWQPIYYLTGNYYCLKATSDVVFNNQYSCMNTKILGLKIGEEKVQLTKIIFTQEEEDKSTWDNYVADSKGYFFNIGDEECEEIVGELDFIKHCEQLALEEFNRKYQKNCKSISDVVKINGMSKFNMIKQKYVAEEIRNYLCDGSRYEITGTIKELLDVLDKNITTSEELNEYYNQLRQEINNKFFEQLVTKQVKRFESLEKQYLDLKTEPIDEEDEYNQTLLKILEIVLSDEERGKAFDLLKYSYVLDLDEDDVQKVNKILKIEPPKKQYKKRNTSKYRKSLKDIVKEQNAPVLEVGEPHAINEDETVTVIRKRKL